MYKIVLKLWQSRFENRYNKVKNIISLHQIQHLLPNIMKKNEIPFNFLMPDVLYQPHGTHGFSVR
jgi:hypothetical protein